MSFLTTQGVNFRAGPSLDSDVISAISLGSRVEVLEHNPAGWSIVRISGEVGYIKSEFLLITAQTSQTAQPDAQSAGSSTQEPTTLRTIDGVNFRSGPSTEASIISTLDPNTSVTVLERDPAGWTRVSAGGTVGYIRSDLLSVSGRNVELLHWSEVRTLLQYNVPIRVIDVRTGRSYNIMCFSIGDHADVDTITQADTDIMFDIRDGVRSWSARPVWVTVGDRLIAASLHGMPHDVSFIQGNGMDGHLCLHFYGSTTSSTSASYRADLQNAVQEAWNAR